MPKLSSPPSRLTQAPVHLARAPDPERRNRYQDGPEWRRWYNTKEWQALRWRVFKRDGFACQVCGRACSGKYPADHSPVADHKVPHKGLRELFYDENNVQTLCKNPCHDSLKQKEEKRGYIAGCDSGVRPTDKRHQWNNG